MVASLTESCEKLVVSKIFWKSVLTCFGLGLLPKAPGTWGSLGALVFWGLLLNYTSFVVFGICFLIFLVLSMLAIRQLEIKDDDSTIVVDEWLGMALALLATNASWPQMGVAFLLFRFFDITKPPGVKFFDQRFLNGWGVMLDDIVAGVYVFVLIGVYRVWFSPV